MSEQTAARPIDVTSPNQARMFDYYLGGKDNFQADRDAAEAVLAVAPQFRQGTRICREILGRVVQHVVSSGVRQIIDLGSGLPTRRNVHEIAHEVDPSTRVVYVDHDPVVVAHGQALLAVPDNVAMVGADLLAPEQVLEHPETRRLIDLREPVAVLIMLTLHLLPDEARPHDAVARYRAAMTPGSMLAVSHTSADAHADDLAPIAAVYRRAGVRFVPRSQDAVREFFGDFDLVPPGLVAMWPHARPPAGTAPVIGRMGWTGVGVKPG